MSTAVKEKKPFLPTRKPSSQPGVAVARANTGLQMAQGSSVVVGGEPRVHLLPIEVVGRKKFKATKRRLFMAVIASVVLVAGAYGFETFTLSSSQNALAAAHAQTASLLTQQGKYGEVTKVKSDISSIQTAQKTGTVQEILWAKFVTSFEATLPAGASINTVQGVIDTPFVTTPTTDDVPLQGPHIATVTSTLSMVQGTIPAWLNSLPKLKGFVDATPDSVVSSGGGLYTVSVTIHLDEDALSNRFTKAGTSK